ncbi:nucleotidyltransferase family protein [Pelosinus sp. sgz500959]|uniref:nucleotidyltransferase family protein n=1 Tax=Pelosinus sp. sgz500959 TaxID=3242472 RepID=UPI003671B19A
MIDHRGGIGYMYDAIILAGGENSKCLSHFSSQPYEAMIEIAGKPMVTFVADALAAAPQVARIFVMGPVKQLAQCSFPENVILVEGGRTITETIQLGMNSLGHKNKVLVVTADIPLLTPTAINDFLTQCSKTEVDLYYPIVSREINNQHYPGNKRTYVRFKDGTYTGGNIFLVNPVIVPQCLAVAKELIDNRKNPFKLCCLLGWGFVLNFLIGTLSLSKVKERVASLLGVTGTVIKSSYPELGIDVDKPSDLELVRTTFSFRI